MLQWQSLHKCHVARLKKCQRTREDVSLQHVPETRPGNFFTSVPTLRFGPCNMSLLHSPATYPVSVYLTRFCPPYILQQHVPATCPLVWAHLKTSTVQISRGICTPEDRLDRFPAVYQSVSRISRANSVPLRILLLRFSRK